MNTADLLRLSAIAGLLHGVGALAADATPTAHDIHQAQCVAALEAQTEALAQQVKAGDAASRPLLLDRLVAGTAIVGDAYLNSRLTEAQARQLAHEAAQEQKDLAPDALAARRNTCAEAGTRLYAAANGLQQKLVQRMARKRMDKLLGG